MALLSAKSDIEAFLARARGGAQAAAAASVLSLDEWRSQTAVAPGPTWGLDNLIGRLVELTGDGGTANVAACVRVIVEAQERGEPAAWICGSSETFFPPDLADSGVDLDALVVVEVPDAQKVARAAEVLLSSGAFGLVILDLTEFGEAATFPDRVMGRLVKKAQHHDAAVVCITERSEDASSLGSVISLRACAQRLCSDDAFSMRIAALKDKQRGPGWTHEIAVVAPPGLE